ncbi:hypothetical protein B0H12DRAFT_1116109, partial [Mycena haematopus]
MPYRVLTISYPAVAIATPAISRDHRTLISTPIFDTSQVDAYSPSLTAGNVHRSRASPPIDRLTRPCAHQLIFPLHRERASAGDRLKASARCHDDASAQFVSAVHALVVQLPRPYAETTHTQHAWPWPLPTQLRRSNRWHDGGRRRRRSREETRRKALVIPLELIRAWVVQYGGHSTSQLLVTLL